MSPLEIEKRLYACDLLRQRNLDDFRAHGVPPASIFMPDLVMRAGVHFDAPWRGCFEFASDANDSESVDEAFIFVARHTDGEISDLVAWTPATGQIASWLGNAALLGAECALRPRLGEGLPVHRTPLAWLQAERNGIVIVDQVEAADLLYASAPLIVTERDHAAHLRRSLARPAPRILIAPSSKFARAA
ncbi:MAG TPA: hypothetical protein VKV96_11100 [Roseiarcus sp.]|nr:hypothetical protein [Roseiarcus sp.]